MKTKIQSRIVELQSELEVEVGNLKELKTASVKDFSKINELITKVLGLKMSIAELKGVLVWEESLKNEKK
jgi:hypothetical protein